MGQVPPAEEVNIWILLQRAQASPTQKLNQSRHKTQQQSTSTPRTGKHFSEREVTGVDFWFVLCVAVFFPQLPERPFEKPP